MAKKRTSKKVEVVASTPDPEVTPSHQEKVARLAYTYWENNEAARAALLKKTGIGPNRKYWDNRLLIPGDSRCDRRKAAIGLGIGIQPSHEQPAFGQLAWALLPWKRPHGLLGAEDRRRDERASQLEPDR